MKLFLVIIITTLSSQFIYSQIYNRDILWQSNRTETVNDQKIQLLYFSNAVYENISTGLPYYFEQIKLLSPSNNAEIEILNSKFEVVPNEQIKDIQNIDSIPSIFEIKNKLAYTRKVPYFQVSFIPLRRNKTTGLVEKLVSFSFKINESHNAKYNLTSRTYAQNSVLNSGKWKKIKVNQTGIYKITYSQIVSYGFQNPENIKVYGNGGKVLSIYNNVFRYDDLRENPIYFEKGTDGIFNQGDYILFYAHGPVYWSYDTNKSVYIHSLHPYSDESYYFLTDEGNSPSLITNSLPEASSPTITVNTFDDYAYHDNDIKNFLKSGKLWVGENFNILLSYDFSFSFSNVVSNDVVKLISSVYARSSAYSTFSYNTNGQSTGNVTVTPTQLSSISSNFANNSIFVKSFNSNSTTFNINVTYDKPSQGGEGWLDYLDINVRKNLILQGGQVQFRDINSVGSGNVADFQISNANSSTLIWDVTNPISPTIVPATLNTNVLSFIAKTDTLREYIVFDKTMFFSPVIVGDVVNQNLHATPATDMVIVSHPDFSANAQTLAEHHRSIDNLSVLVVTPEEIYNEFSSGSPDVTAVKDFMKMLYDKAGTDSTLFPKYLLLYGDGSYDNKHNFSTNTNFILTYESNSSLVSTNSFTTDDYFGMLDDSEGDYIGVLDIGIGRLPVKTTAESQGVLNKILNYVKPSTNGDWKNALTFIGDDEDNNEHMWQSDSCCRTINKISPAYNIEKIFLDAYPEIATPNGDRYPDVNIAIANKMKKGTFLVNYTGHGNEIGLAHERIIGVSDINSWTNFEKLPLFVTATCEFSRYDDYSRTAAGEQVFLNPAGGAISMFTTTRLVYSNSNFVMNLSFVRYIFGKDNQGSYYRLGDIYRLAKNATSSTGDVNKRNFTLLGDPALMLAYPKYSIVTDSINGISATIFNDTLKALQKITIKGHIENGLGSIVNGYNGIIYPTIYDKAISMTTLGNGSGQPFPFKQQNNVLFKGKASIINSYFEFTFIVPKDIQYNIGYGKISYYGENQTILDANGSNNTFYIGGNSPGTITDNQGPRIELYMNDDNFVYGGITNENPDIYSKLIDENGINTVGNGIGHDITAVIDENTKNTIVLNEYYEGNLNDFQSGIVRYPLSSLSSGQHKLKMKAWDVCNNSSEATTEFVVADVENLTLGNIFNYPNPFTTNTSFYFDHNQPNINLDVLIQVFTVTGKLVKTLKTSILSNSFHSTAIPWDGLDDYGDKIGKGVYIYKLTVKTSTDLKEEKFEKLVILR